MSDEIPEDVQRGTSKRSAALVLFILKGETSVQEAARKHGLTVAEIEDWREVGPHSSQKAGLFCRIARSRVPPSRDLSLLP